MHAPLRISENHLNGRNVCPQHSISFLSLHLYSANILYEEEPTYIFFLMPADLGSFPMQLKTKQAGAQLYKVTYRLRVVSDGKI